MFKTIQLLLKRSFTWWNSQTWGTWLFTKRFGIFVGRDADNNQYYENADKTRRWVIYSNYSDASSVPPDWHAWLHKMVNTAPSIEAFHEKPWEKPHKSNPTGTENAYYPPSSLLNSKTPKRRKSSGDYEAWTP